MNLKNRNRLLALARFLDRRAAAIRATVKRNTPKRGPRQSTELKSEAQRLPNTP